MIFVGPGGPPNLSWRERLRLPLMAFSGMPRALRLVWATQPILTVLLGMATLFQALIPAAGAWVGKLTIDAVVNAVAQPALGFEAVAQPLLLGVGLALAGQALNAVRQLSQDLLRDQLTYRINAMILDKALTLDLEFFETPHKQDMLQRAWQEASFRPLMLLQETFMLVQNLITIITLTALMLRFSVWVVLLLLVTGLPALYVQSKYARESFMLHSLRAGPWRRLMYYSMLLTNVHNVKEIKLFGLGRLLLDRYKTLYAQFMRENRALALRRNAASSALQLLGQVGYYGAYVAVILQTLAGRLTLGDLTLYSAVLMQAPMIAQSLMGVIGSIYEQNLFIGNLFAFLGLQPRVPPGGVGQPAPEALRQVIEFRNVTFRYPGATEDALHNVSLTIRPGEKIALVGENGAGKTTLIKLLARLYDPMSGTITLDGVDLRELDPASVQARIGVIFQDFVHYHLTARENIGFGQVEALDDEARIVAAARKSGAHEIIAALPHAYETMLGREFMRMGRDGQDEGHDLSFGQWQKVALARAFMRDAPVLILDEPTASLDARAEYEIFKRFQELAADRTTILISHRFSTVRMADRIIVLENGRVIEQGAHAELLAAGGKYATLFNMQAEGYR
jgi:ATP-binding cassette subfamily B protein